mmetsp:Transcript_11179/g.36797  ORF Transcript_11179/g.36797 Transcript_11179/m.36797 type:complete len:807 (+) Transcript_11179:72-2492(+)
MATIRRRNTFSIDPSDPLECARPPWMNRPTEPLGWGLMRCVQKLARLSASEPLTLVLWRLARPPASELAEGPSRETLPAPLRARFTDDSALKRVKRGVRFQNAYREDPEPEPEPRAPPAAPQPEPPKPPAEPSNLAPSPRRGSIQFRRRTSTASTQEASVRRRASAIVVGPNGPSKAAAIAVEDADAAAPTGGDLATGPVMGWEDVLRHESLPLSMELEHVFGFQGLLMETLGKWEKEMHTPEKLFSAFSAASGAYHSTGKDYIWGCSSSFRKMQQLLVASLSELDNFAAEASQPSSALPDYMTQRLDSPSTLPNPAPGGGPAPLGSAGYERDALQVMLEQLDAIIVGILVLIIQYCFAELIGDESISAEVKQRIELLASHFMKFSLPGFARAIAEHKQLSAAWDAKKVRQTGASQKQISKMVKLQLVVNKTMFLDSVFSVFHVVVFPISISDAHRNGVKALALPHTEANAGHLLTGGYDGLLRIWRLSDQKCVAQFAGHKSIVPEVKFTMTDHRIISCSFDKTIKVWVPSTGACLLTLTGHEDALAFLSWSPSDEHLLTCSSDRTVRLWEVSSGRCLHVFRKHTDQVTAAAWMPDGKRIVSGGLDKHIFMWDLNGQELHRWNGARVNDLGITKDGRWMVTVCSEKKIRLFNFDEWREDCITETDSITSLSIADDSRHLLVNLASQEIHLWHLSPTVSGAAAPLPTAPVVKYRSLPGKMGRYVIRSCFGGANQPFVVSGGEDSQIYIFHRDKGDLLDVLSGHSGTVNAVSWNPRDPWMFCSASDDKSIRVWVSPVARGNQTSADTS